MYRHLLNLKFWSIIIEQASSLISHNFNDAVHSAHERVHSTETTLDSWKTHVRKNVGSPERHTLVNQKHILRAYGTECREHYGYCDWKHDSDRLGDHEQYKYHNQAVVSATSHETKSGLTDCWHSFRIMTLTFRIVVGNLKITPYQWVGDTMVFKLKWQLRNTMRCGYSVLDIHWI